jgi:hypothetical protein
MSIWIQWNHFRKSVFDMLRPIWVANLDIMVDNVRYLHDDSDEHQQSYFANFPDKPNQSQFGDKSTNECGDIYTTTNCRTCNGTKPNCYCNYPSNNRNYGKYYDDVGYRDSTRSTEGKRNSTWVWDCYEYSVIEPGLQHAARTNERIY